MEVLIVISIMATLLTWGSSLIGLMLKSEGQIARSLVAGLTWSRLAEVFREDVHAASEVDLGQENQNGTRLELHRPEGRILYKVGGNRIVRTLRKGEDRIESRKTFKLPDGKNRFQYRRTAALVTFIHDRRLGKPSEQNRPSSRLSRRYRIQAVLGRDHRFRQSGGQP